MSTMSNVKTLEEMSLGPGQYKLDDSLVRNKISFPFGTNVQLHTMGGSVMDGNFVPDITFGPNLVSQLKKILDIDIEVHLMVNNPESKINSFNQAGADVLTFHYESVNDSIEKTITEIKNLNCRVGLAINPDTEVNEIQKYLPDLDEVTVMTVVPGKGLSLIHI